MSAATYADLIGLLGDIDELMVERIVETGATIDEVAEALEGLEDEHERRLDGSSRVAAVREILGELLDEGDDDASPSYAPAPSDVHDA